MTDQPTLRERQGEELAGLDKLHRQEVKDLGGHLEPDHDPKCNHHGNTALDDEKGLAAGLAVDRMAGPVLGALLDEGAEPHLLAELLAYFLYVVLEEDALVWAEIWDNTIAIIEADKKGDHAA